MSLEGLSETGANVHWSAESLCPQCGARVELSPGDPVLSCAFCKTRLYIASKGPLRYVMHSAADASAEAGPLARTIHLPFWRFRGLSYRVMNRAMITGSLLDMTVAALPGLADDATLGIRPQIAPLSLITDDNRFTAPQRGAREALFIAESRVQGMQDETALFERFVGASKCIVYTPFTLIDSDGGDGYILKGPPGTMGYPHRIDRTQRGLFLSALEKTEQQGPLHFLPLLCPECGHDLPAEAHAVGLICAHCCKAWRVGEGRFVRLPYRISDVSSPGGSDAFFPFWRLSLDLTRLPIKSRADLLIAAIPYRSPPASWRTEAVQLLIPAFKLPPKLFLRVARNASLATVETPPDNTALRPGEKTEPIRLSLDEAAQAAKVVLADLLKHRRRLYPLVPEAHLKVRRSSLLFLPFASQGNEWIDISSSQAIPENAIELGRQI